VLHPKYNIQAILLMLMDLFFKVQAITCLLCPRSTEFPDPLVTNFQMKASGSQATKKNSITATISPHRYSRLCSPCASEAVKKYSPLPQNRTKTNP
jgi:hypothetical protein